jgi:hypothetical protein
MKPTSSFSRVAAASLLALAGASQAGVIEGADVGGFRTFIDTNTGTVWADLDNHLAFTGSAFTFRFTDRDDYLAQLQAAGFTYASGAEVAALTATLPMATTLDHGQLGLVMGSLSYGETNNLDGYADEGGGLHQRHFGLANWGAGSAQWALGGAVAWPTALNDAGLWAYIAGPGGPGGSVPVPSTLALAALGLCALSGRLKAQREGVMRDTSAAGRADGHWPSGQ